jgi:NAD(P)-dependent dehydrogenase (short-subunit alcohol dehydrogenase family)
VGRGGKGPPRRGCSSYVHLNVTREPDWRTAVATAVETYGKLDALVTYVTGSELVIDGGTTAE